MTKMDETAFWRDADGNYHWFDEVYKAAGDEPLRVPWVKARPNRMLLEWLYDNKVDGLGQRALVIGCGLGDDAELLSAAGFAVTAFDISETAIAWCEKRHKYSTVEYLAADLFKLPASFAGDFDFVFEASTLQALPRKLLKPAMEAIADILHRDSLLMVVAFGRQKGDRLPEEPPWPLLKSELDYFQQLGLEEKDCQSITVRKGGRPGPRYRILYQPEQLDSKKQG